MIHADKGFDGLQILTSPQNKNLVTKVIITEDKATEHARDHVRDKVWPDFIKTESNERQSALIARTTEGQMASSLPVLRWTLFSGIRLELTE